METQRRVARPMGNEVYEVIDMFLGMPECDSIGNPIKYNRIDTFNKKELLVLSTRKLKLHLSYNKYNTLTTFLEEEVKSARSKQSWFDPKKEKKHYFSLDHYITYLRNNFIIDLFEKVRKASNWIEVFDAIDVEIPIQTEAHVTTTNEQKRNFVLEASFNLTCQYLHEFKRKILFLSDEHKITFIEQMNIKKPNPLFVLKNDDKDKEAFDQINYTADNNYFDFLTTYKEHLKHKKMAPNFCVGSTTYGPEIYDKVKKLKPEFDLITDYKEKLQFFVKNDLSLECRAYPTTPDHEKQKLPENKLSIEPNSDEEIITFNQFFFNWFAVHSPLGSAFRKKDYYERIENGANDIELTKRLISDIEQQYEKDKQSPLPNDFKLYSFAAGYERSSLYADKEKFFTEPKIHNTISFFCSGYNAEVFNRLFLKVRLKQLENPLPKVIDPLENLNKTLHLYDVFIINCEISFQDDINDPRGIKIWKQCDELMGLDIDDITHRAFEESKKLMATNSNAEKLLSTYLFESQSRTNRIDKLIEKYNLYHHINFNRFNYFHSTIGWLQNFRNKLQRLLNPQVTIPNWFDEPENATPVQISQSSNAYQKTDNNNIEKKEDSENKIDKTPKINEAAEKELYPILSEYFDENDHNSLKELLATGKQTNNKKILFKGKGNQLCDVFKQLFTNRLLTCNENKDLENWIIGNFQFIHRSSAKDYSPATVEKSISGDTYNCMNPIIEIEDGKIKKVAMKKRQYTKQ